MLQLIFLFQFILVFPCFKFISIYTIAQKQVLLMFLFFVAASLVSMSQGKLSAMLNISCRRNGQTVLLPWILHRLINLS